jgi:hypothetical protein
MVGCSSFLWSHFSVTPRQWGGGVRWLLIRLFDSYENRKCWVINGGRAKALLSLISKTMLLHFGIRLSGCPQRYHCTAW